MTNTTQKFSLIVEIDLQTLSDNYIECHEAEPDSLQSMIESEWQWIQDSGIYLKQIQEIKEIDGIDFQAAEYAINQDGSFLHQINSRWGIFDAGESPAHPVVNYTYPTKEELIIWYFQDMGWDLNIYATFTTKRDHVAQSQSQNTNTEKSID
jgi:hypothetical protein